MKNGVRHTGEWNKHKSLFDLDFEKEKRKKKKKRWNKWHDWTL